MSFDNFVLKIKGWLPGIIHFGLKIVLAMFIFLLGKILIKMLLKFCKRFFDRTKLEVGVSKFLISLVRAIAYVILFLIILETVGVKTTSFLAIFTSASLALGLALQGSLSNFAGGVLILILKPFKVGDYIITSADGMEGKVSKIDLFYTTLITSDNKLNVIPNGALSNASLTNVTAFEIRRVDLYIGISYDADISKAKKLINECAKSCDLVLKNREIFTFVYELEASQVTIGLRVWANTNDYWNVKFGLTEIIKEKLDEEGIEIPYNQIVVHNQK